MDVEYKEILMSEWEIIKSYIFWHKESIWNDDENDFEELRPILDRILGDQGMTNITEWTAIDL